MIALLDTHTFVWAISTPDKLSDTAAAFVGDPTNQLLVSAASAWELSTKVRLGKFDEAEPIVFDYQALVDRLGAANLAISERHALRAGQLSWSHRDPFDRMLAAQALIENVPLLSRDRAFAELGALQVIW